MQRSGHGHNQEILEKGSYQVTCINKRSEHDDPHERIQYIGQQGKWKVFEDSAVRRMESGQDSFYTSVNNRPAEVVVATHNGRKYSQD